MSIVEEKNKTFLQKLNDQEKELLKLGKNFPGHIDKSDNGTAFIRPEDEEKYDAIQELKGYLEFKTYDPQQTFLLPGVTIDSVKNDKGQPLQMTICIQEKDIEKILNKIDKYSQLGIKFPDQLYQFKYKDKLLPGKSCKAPRPMLVEETEEQYEAFLKGYYEQNGEQQELIGNEIKTRKPYTHEMIAYAEGETDSINKGHTSEYYNSYFRNAMEKEVRQPSPGAGNNRAQDGEEYVFTESVKGEKIPFLQRVGSFTNGIKTNLANGSIGTKIKTVAGLAIVVGIGGAALTSTYVWPVALVGVASYATYKLALPLLKKIKAKMQDLLYGKKIESPEQPTPNPTGDNGGSDDQGDNGADSGSGDGLGSGGNGGQEQPQGDDEFNMRIEGLLDELNKNAELYKKIESQITVAEEELAQLDSNSPTYKQQQEKLNQLKEQKRAVLEIVRNHIKSYGQKPTQTGGPHL